MAELVDARDLKSLGPCDCTSSILVPGTNKNKGLQRKSCNPFLMPGNQCKLYVSSCGHKKNGQLLADRSLEKLTISRVTAPVTSPRWPMILILLSHNLQPVPRLVVWFRVLATYCHSQ